MKKMKRIFALTGAILLIVLYVVTLVLAFGKSVPAKQWFMMCFGGTFLIPFVLYAMWIMYRVLNGRKQEIDEMLSESDEDEEE